MESFSKLLSMLACPLNKVGADGNWVEVETNLGFHLPDDYKSFVKTYGAGSIGQLPLSVSSPFSQSNNLQMHIDGTTAVYHKMVSDGWDFPFSRFPEKGSLLSWGNTGNGDYLNWLIEGTANEWPIVVWQSADAEFSTFRMNMVSFLTEVLSNQLQIFPNSLLQPPFTYMPSLPI